MRCGASFSRRRIYETERTEDGTSSVGYSSPLPEGATPNLGNGAIRSKNSATQTKKAILPSSDLGSLASLQSASQNSSGSLVSRRNLSAEDSSPREELNSPISLTLSAMSFQTLDTKNPLGSHVFPTFVLECYITKIYLYKELFTTTNNQLYLRINTTTSVPNATCSVCG